MQSALGPENAETRVARQLAEEEIPLSSYRPMVEVCRPPAKKETRAEKRGRPSGPAPQGT